MRIIGTAWVFFSTICIGARIFVALGSAVRRWCQWCVLFLVAGGAVGVRSGGSTRSCTCLLASPYSSRSWRRHVPLSSSRWWGSRKCLVKKSRRRLAFGSLDRNSPTDDTVVAATSPAADRSTRSSPLLSNEQRDRLSNLLEQRATARARGDYEKADNLKEDMLQYASSLPLPEGIVLQICDIARREGGGSSWRFVRNSTSAMMEPMKGQTVLQMAHAALGLATIASSSTTTTEQWPPQVAPPDGLKELVYQAKERLEQSDRVQVELRGRKAADAAFWFALAGVTDSDLFDALAKVVAKEVRRYGTRSSCRAKDVWHVLERVAGAGICSHEAVEQAARIALASKNDDDASSNDSDLLRFHSDRCLLMIWKFSTRQRKQRSFLRSAVEHWEHQHAPAGGNKTTSRLSSTTRNNIEHQNEWEWSKLYRDPTRPLVIDLGCGMGVSLLGLAQCSTQEDSSSCPVKWTDCNFAGVDLSALAVGYARGLSHRWGLNDRLHFFVSDVCSFLKSVRESYPGPVILCLVQFPTPYRLHKHGNLSNGGAQRDSERDGNSQLPVDATKGFMVTKGLLRLVSECLEQTERASLLIQSNCEDVAIFLRNMACNEDVGFEHFENSDSAMMETCLTSAHQQHVRLPKRTLDWISMGGERAEGKGWSTRPILPLEGRTETEVACMMNNVPVHRCLLKVRCKSALKS